jgi:glycosyltransferase involved in cell wall biosynthesis
MGSPRDPAAAPVVSVVTVAFNACDTIEQTLTSVLGQTYPAVDYVVVDGASTDGTTDIIRRYGSGLAAWVSEPDSGIAEAMNKGLARTRGELVLFLHADDYLVEAGTLAAAMAAVRRAEADIYAFDILYGADAGAARRRSRGFGWRMHFKTGIFHQGAICRRGLFDALGPFDTRLGIAMDYDFFLRAYRAGATVRRVPQPLSVMRDGGIGSRRDWPTLSRRLLEERAIHQRLASSRLLRAVYGVYWPLYFGYRRLWAAREAA